jgi:hypothetical protein
MITTLRRLGHVSSEGGPFLILDAAWLGDWGGEDLGDYQRVCDWLDEHPDQPGYQADIGPSSGLVWELGGAGTADVFRQSDSRVVLSRPWLKENNEDLAMEAAAAASTSKAPFGTLIVETGTVLIFWSPERGSGVEFDRDAVADGEPLVVAGMDGAGLAINLPPGRYSAWHDEVKTDRFQARRCWLLPEGARL